MKTLNLYSPPGIGDSLWPLLKVLPNLPSDTSIKLHTYERNSNHSSPFLTSIHGIESVHAFREPFNSYSKYVIECDKLYKSYQNITVEKLAEKSTLKLEMNRFLEGGNRIEGFLPNLPMTFKVPWKYNKDLYKEAINTIGTKRKTIVIYTSSIANNNNGNFTSMFSNWKANNWVEFVKVVRESYPTANLIWVGAGIDTDLGEVIKKEVPSIQYFVNKPAEFLVPLLRECDCFISYQSGISVISVLENVPTLMVYYNTLSSLRRSWVPPVAVHNEVLYKPIQFKNLDAGFDPIMNWIKIHMG